MKILLRFVGKLALVLVVATALLAAFVFSGVYDVSATSGHSKLIAGTFSTLMIRSVRAHARDISPPAGLNFREPALLEKAAVHYEIMCRTCHGAPGKKPDPWEFYPPVPDLVEALREKGWSDAEVFWITKHGIKDTAMSAFGGSGPGAHSDEEIWGLTALIRQFATMTPEQYQSFSEQAPTKQDGPPATGRPQVHEGPPAKSEQSPSQKHKH